MIACVSGGPLPLKPPDRAPISSAAVPPDARASMKRITAAAYVLLQELRRHLAATTCVTGQVGTLQERLVKLSTPVTVSARSRG